MYGYEVEIARTKDLQKIIADFSGRYQIYPAIGLHGPPLILHISDVSSTDYALVSLVGAGLRDTEITVVFVRMISRKIKAIEAKMEFPVSPDTLIKLDTYNAVKEIFSVLSY